MHRVCAVLLLPATRGGGACAVARPTSPAVRLARASARAHAHALRLLAGCRNSSTRGTREATSRAVVSVLREGSPASADARAEVARLAATTTACQPGTLHLIVTRCVEARAFDGVALVVRALAALHPPLESPCRALSPALRLCLEPTPGTRAVRDALHQLAVATKGRGWRRSSLHTLVSAHCRAGQEEDAWAVVELMEAGRGEAGTGWDGGASARAFTPFFNLYARQPCAQHLARGRALLARLGAQRGDRPLDDVACTAALGMLAAHGCTVEALGALREMEAWGVAASDGMYTAVLKGCAQVRDLATGAAVHDTVVRGGGPSPSPVVVHMLAKVYLACGAREQALAVFQSALRAPHTTAAAAAAAGGGNSSSNDVGTARVSAPSSSSLPEALHASTPTMLLNSFLRAGALHSARLVREGWCTATGASQRAPERLVAAAVQVSVADGDFQAALREARAAAPRHSEVVWTAMARGCGRWGSLGFARTLEGLVEGGRGAATALLDGRPRTFGSLLTMWAKCGDLARVRELVPALWQGAAGTRDAVAWAIALEALGLFGLGREAMGCFAKMQEMGVRPDEAVLQAVLSACANAGDLPEEAQAAFDDVSRLPGVHAPLTAAHYTLLALALGRGGHVARAEAVALSCPPQLADPTLWRGVLSVCSDASHLHTAELAADRATALGDSDGGALGLLHALFTRIGAEDRAEAVRARLPPGAPSLTPSPAWVHAAPSLEVHRFAWGPALPDDPRCARHHDTREGGGAALASLRSRLEAGGYQPLPGVSVLDAQCQVLAGKARVDALWTHPERAALALALQGEDSEVRVLKSGRLCEDCVQVFRLAAALYGRSVWVRERGSRWRRFAAGG